MCEVSPLHFEVEKNPSRAGGLKNYIRFAMGPGVFQIRVNSSGEPWVSALPLLFTTRRGCSQVKVLGCEIPSVRAEQGTWFWTAHQAHRLTSGRVRVRPPWMRRVLLPDVLGGPESGMGPRQSVVTSPRPSPTPKQFVLLPRPWGQPRGPQNEKSSACLDLKTFRDIKG